MTEEEIIPEEPKEEINYPAEQHMDLPAMKLEIDELKIKVAILEVRP